MAIIDDEQEKLEKQLELLIKEIDLVKKVEAEKEEKEQPNK